ncbi:MAG: ABC transporter ATP-binding protein [Ignavibacteriaceae bacterium]|jgi:ATP-binding cassette subfamily B protein
MKNLFSLKKYFARYKSKLLWGMVFMVFSDTLAVYVILLSKNAINALTPKVTIPILVYYASMIVLVTFIAGIFRFFIRQTIIVASREIEFDLRADFWNHIQQLPLRYFQNNSTGNIMAHATNDINAVRTFLGPAVMYSMDTIINLVITIAMMISISPSLSLYSILPLPFLSIIVYKIAKKIHEKFTLIQERFSELTTKAQENYSGIRVVKSYVREANEIYEFEKLSKGYLQRNMDMIKIQSYLQPALFFITGLSTIIVIWIGGIKIINHSLNLGDIVAFLMCIGNLTWPMIAFGWVTNMVQQGEASMKRLNKIFAEPYEIDDNNETLNSKTDIDGKIEFKNVSFRYGEELPFILKDVNLKIPAGSILAIMGYTGEGKTSLINLIPRLYDCTEGDVLIDGLSVKLIPLQTLRTNIGLVPQESFLFSDTITNNISYGLRDINKEKVIESSRIAHFDKDVESFPNTYETIMGERGITLSGGQKQRACLARALSIDPRILILDDSFSAVDTNTEEEILKSLKEYMRGRTCIIISHRISTVKDADKIIVLSKGKIAEQGSHDELIETGGIYADLYYKQLLEKELEELK